MCDHYHGVVAGEVDLIYLVYTSAMKIERCDSSRGETDQTTTSCVRWVGRIAKHLDDLAYYV